MCEFVCVGVLHVACLLAGFSSQRSECFGPLLPVSLHCSFCGAAVFGGGLPSSDSLYLSINNFVSSPSDSRWLFAHAPIHSVKPCLGRLVSPIALPAKGKRRITPGKV